MLGGAGWSDIAVQPVSVEAPHPAGEPNAVADMVMGNVPPLAEALRQKPEVAGDVRAAIADALRAHEREGRVVLGAAAWSPPPRPDRRQQSIAARAGAATIATALVQ